MSLANNDWIEVVPAGDDVLGAGFWGGGEVVGSTYGVYMPILLRQVR